MCKDNKQTKCKQLEFNTYCIFTEEKKDVKETIGLIFKDYLENIKKKLSNYSYYCKIILSTLQFNCR